MCRENFQSEGMGVEDGIWKVGDIEWKDGAGRRRKLYTD